MTALGDMKTFKGELKYLNQISLKGEILKMNKSSILYRPKILGDATLNKLEQAGQLREIDF